MGTALKQGSAAQLAFQNFGAHASQEQHQILSWWNSLSGSTHLLQQHLHLPEVGSDCSPNSPLPTALTSVALLCSCSLFGLTVHALHSQGNQQNLGPHLRRSLDVFSRYKCGQNGSLS